MVQKQMHHPQYKRSLQPHFVFALNIIKQVLTQPSHSTEFPSLKPADHVYSKDNLQGMR